MWLRIAVNRKATLSDLGHCIRCGCFDPVHLSGKQRGSTRIGFRNRQQDDAIDLWLALWIPVVFVGNHFNALARNETRHLEGAATRSIGSKSGPSLSGTICWSCHRRRHGCQFLAPVLRRSDKEVGQVDRQERIGFTGGQLNSEIINFFRATQRWHT